MSIIAETATRTDAEQAAWDKLVTTGLGGNVTFETVADDYEGVGIDDIIRSTFEDNEVDAPEVYQIPQARVYAAGDVIIVVQGDDDILVIAASDESLPFPWTPGAISEIHSIRPQTLPEIMAAVDAAAVLVRGE